MSWKKKKKKVYGNIVIYGLVNRLSMLMVISNIDFSDFIYIFIALWCKNQIEHSIWDESLLFCNCACSLEYSS